MFSADVIVILVAIAIVVIVVAGLISLIAKFYIKVEQGKALIVNTMAPTPLVTFTGKVVLPIFHKAEVMDISLKTVEIDRQGKEGLICKDNMRADIKVTFFVRVNKDQASVMTVAHTIGCARASDPDTLEELFSAKFSEALKTVGKQMNFVDLYQQRHIFRDKIIDVIDKDLNGYVLEDVAIDYLEQTSLTDLDPHNILDAEGIRKITELTAIQHVATNIAKKDEEMKLKKKNVEAREAILELERQQADAEAKQAREIATVRAREASQIEQVKAEERLKAEKARISTEQQVAVGEQNKAREIEVAQKNRERAVAIEIEKVQRAKSLEAISREREVEKQRIEKDKELETERKVIQDIVRERIAIDKTVAEEEERIKDLRMIAEAERLKKVRITEAEAEAEQSLVKDIKAAEASKQAAIHRATEINTLAQAELEAAEKRAKAKIRMAEGTQAEQAAEGLAVVKVKEADAIAVERQGVAEAKVMLERLSAQASGEEQIGMAQVRVKEADALAIEKQGLAAATVTREQLTATAVGEEEQGMARTRVQEAEAQAIEKRGLAEATAIREKLVAEAAGLTEKFAAMQSMDTESRRHEEYRLDLENHRTIQLEAIGARKEVAEAQAEILGQAFKTAKIDIVGGDGEFFENFVKAISVTKSMDGFVERGDTAKALLADYLDGSKSLPQDVKDVLTRPSVGSEQLQQLSIAAFLGQMMKGGDSSSQARLGQLLDYAKKLGVADNDGN